MVAALRRVPFDHSAVAMFSLLRGLVVLSSLALIAVAVIPFDRPHAATFPADQLPPLSMLAALWGLLTYALLAVAAYGLLRFRRWAPGMAALTTFLVAVLALMLMLTPDLASVVSATAKTLAIVAAVSWALAAVLARTPTIKGRFANAR